MYTGFHADSPQDIEHSNCRNCQLTYHVIGILKIFAPNKVYIETVYSGSRKNLSLHLDTCSLANLKTERRILLVRCPD